MITFMIYMIDTVISGISFFSCFFFSFFFLIHKSVKVLLVVYLLRWF